MRNKLAHTVWECKNHVVWIPQYRRKVIYGKFCQDIGSILRRLCDYYVSTVGLDEAKVRNYIKQ